MGIGIEIGIGIGIGIGLVTDRHTHRQTHTSAFTFVLCPQNTFQEKGPHEPNGNGGVIRV
jgi:hypothetical protein